MLRYSFFVGRKKKSSLVLLFLFLWKSICLFVKRCLLRFLLLSTMRNRVLLLFWGLPFLCSNKKTLLKKTQTIHIKHNKIIPWQKEKKNILVYVLFFILLLFCLVTLNFASIRWIKAKKPGNFPKKKVIFLFFVPRVFFSFSNGFFCLNLPFL